MAFSAADLNADTDNDGINDIDELYTYGTNPNIKDTDADEITDGNKVASWGANWNVDFDGDGLINILDKDSDGDNFSDWGEINRDTDPSDPNSIPGYKNELPRSRAAR